MIFSIIFIILSVIVGIATWLYMRKSNSASILNIKGNKQSNNAEHSISSLNIASEKLSIDDISNGVITLENYKKRVILLKIKNSDFNMLSKDSQGVTESILRQIAMSLQYDIGFYSTTRAIDTAKPLEKPRQVAETTDNLKIQRYAINYINTFDNIVANKRVHRREDFIILTYIGDMAASAKELERRARQFVNALNKINTKCELVSTDQLIDLIYHDINRNDYFNPSNSIKLGALDLYVGHDDKRRLDN